MIYGALPAGELSLLAGPGSVGKSLLALQLGAALACDRGPLLAGASIEATAPTLASAPGGAHAAPLMVFECSRRSSVQFELVFEIDVAGRLKQKDNAAMSDKRKPVAALHNGSRLIVVCDDGSVWTGALVGRTGTDTRHAAGA